MTQLGPIPYATPSQNVPPPSYVYYAKDDYAKLFRRLMALTIDATVIVLLGFLIAPLAALDFVSPGFIFMTWLAAAWIYLGPIKRTSIRTVGYRIMGLQIVNYHGKRPSLLQMTIRPGIALLFTPLLDDISWIPGDRCRQALRDKIGNTYVIRQDAKPIGIGRLVYVRHFFLGRNFIFREIEKAD